MDLKTKTKKQDPETYCLQETHIKLKDTLRRKVKRWENIFQSSGNRKAEVAILVPHKIDFKTKAITRDKEGNNHKGADPTKNTTLVNIYTTM